MRPGIDPLPFQRRLLLAEGQLKFVADFLEKFRVFIEVLIVTNALVAKANSDIFDFEIRIAAVVADAAGDATTSAAAVSAAVAAAAARTADTAAVAKLPLLRSIFQLVIVVGSLVVCLELMTVRRLTRRNIVIIVLKQFRL